MSSRTWRRLIEVLADENRGVRQGVAERANGGGVTLRARP